MQKPLPMLWPFIENPMPDFSFEETSLSPVVGVDEAGYGPWAGPLVCASVWLNPQKIPAILVTDLNDSKKLTKSKREFLFEILRKGCGIFCEIGVGVATPQEIDTLNVLKANFRAMERAVQQLKIVPKTLLVDGIRNPGFHPNTLTIKQGDGRSLSIAAASIIAKVTRDRFMTELAGQYPVYGWDTNAGYGTASHIRAIKEHGITPHHRQSYKPIKAIMNEADSTRKAERP